MEDVFPWEEEALDVSVEFHTEDINFDVPNAHVLSAWIEKLVAQESYNLRQITFVFCSDAYLLDLNQQYLDHDTYTDIITFQYANKPDVEGDIFISLDRIRENAAQYNVSLEDELHRVMSHGVLHLCGYGDKSLEEKKRMTEKENQALELLKSLFSEKN